MSFPSKKELKVVRAKLSKVEPSRPLPKNPSKVEKLKYKLCREFVLYLIENDLTQVQLAKKLKLDPARVNEIVKYRIDLFTVDKLLNLAEKLMPNIEIAIWTISKCQ